MIKYILYGISEYSESLGVFSVLPNELIINILLYLSDSDLLSLNQVSKEFYEYTNDNILWLSKLERLERKDLERKNLANDHHLIKFVYYKWINRWQWSRHFYDKSPELILSNDGLVVSCIQPNNLLPYVAATKSLNGKRDYFEVKILQMGEWFAIGIKEENKPSTNIMIYQNLEERSINLILTTTNKKQHQQLTYFSTLQVGDCIKLVINLNNSSITYYINNYELVTLSDNVPWLHKKFYPYVYLSYNSTLTFNI